MSGKTRLVILERASIGLTQLDPDNASLVMMEIITLTPASDALEIRRSGQISDRIRIVGLLAEIIYTVDERDPDTTVLTVTDVIPWDS